MTAKPSMEQEALASRLITEIDGERSALIDELRILRPRVDADPAQLDVARSLATRFEKVGPSIHTKLRQLSDPDRIDQLLDELSMLDCSAIRNTCEAVLAYLVKYRYIELTDLSRTDRSSTSVVPMWELPKGSDSLAADFVSRVESDPSPAMQKIQIGLRSAPWLGRLSKIQSIQSVIWMKALGLVEFGYDTRLVAQGAPDPGVPVLRLSEDYPDERTRAAIGQALRAEESRRRLVRDFGVGVRGIGGEQTFRIFADASGNDVIKIATYHFRTVLGDRKLSDWLLENRTLRLEIMCLGPTAVEELTEGADPDSLTESLVEGIHAFHAMKSELPTDIRKRVQIRIYGDSQASGLFRGAILCASGNSPAGVRRVVATVWPYGASRANYGEVLVLEGDSNLSRLCVEYYDAAWRNAVPLDIGGNFVRLRWVVSSLQTELLTSACLGVTAAAIFLANDRQYNSDAFFALLGIVPVVGLAFWKAARRLWRSGRLAVKIRMRERYR